MAAISPTSDATLAAVDEAMMLAQIKNKSNAPRSHLGMSLIGGCGRKTALNFLWVGGELHNALTLKRFADGFSTEDLILERLKLLPYLTIVDLVDDRQVRVDGHKGHFVGHLDFEVLGLLQAPKTWHVGEVKSVGDSNWKKFKRCRDRYKEKDVLKEFNETYYAQAQCYMKYRKRKRHWLIVSEAGGRDWDAVRTDYNAEDAQSYEDLAKQIIDHPNDTLPDKISESAEYFMCKYMCQYTSICYDRGKVQRNCRTCLYGAPMDSGKWLCQKHERLLSYDEQLVGCDDQRYRLTYLIDNKEWTDGGSAT
jgi:hypothetical protein